MHTLQGGGAIPLEKWKDVNDKSIKVSGRIQHMSIPDNHASHVNIKLGLAYMNIRPYADDERNTLPHGILKPLDECDPTIIE